MGYPNDARQAGNYERGGNSNDYSFNPGVCVLPLAEDPPTDENELADWSPVVVLRLHAPIRYRKFTQMAVKNQNPPPIAAPEDTGAFVFLGGSVAITTNLNTSFRNYDWSVGCTYTFVENCVSRNEDGLVLGTLPYGEVMNSENANQYGYAPPVPLIGAVAYGGRAVTTGNLMGQSIVGNEDSGELLSSWGYNDAAYYPGSLFYSDLPNGGLPVVEE